MSPLRNYGAPLLVFILCIFGIFFFVEQVEAPAIQSPPGTETASSSAQTLVATSTESVATTTVATSTTTTTATSSAATSSKPKAKKASIQATKSISPVTPSSPNDITRIETPYSTPPSSFESINVSARAALVNILCMTKTTGSLQPISGSGVMIDPRGVILTNAHVAQYVLIAQSGRTDLSCTIRTGTPAVAKWIPLVMYIPPVWIDLHAADIVKSRALGTGEHDYALLYVAKTIDSSPLPSSFAYVAPDSREAIAFVDDNVLAASYPVEFAGSSVVQGDLYPVTSITTVRQLMTFTVGKADALSLGGIIGAQSGSSGGGVVNQWNRLVGLITTTSSGATTGERDLHAVSTAYIDRDLRSLTGRGLTDTLAADPGAATEAFIPTADSLADKLFSVITGR